MNNIVPINPNTQTMTLKEITDLLDIRHDKALAKVSVMAKNPEFGTMPKTDIVYNNKGQTIETYILNQRQSIAVASQLNVALLMRVIDRWQELEKKEEPFNIPQTLPEALQLAADLAKKIEEDKPKISVYEALADRKQDVSTTLLAKHLGMSAIKLNKLLREHNVKMLNIDAPKAGYLEWFNVVSDVKNGHEFHQCLITPKGQIGITKLLSKESQTNRGNKNAL